MIRVLPPAVARADADAIRLTFTTRMRRFLHVDAVGIARRSLLLLVPAVMACSSEPEERHATQLEKLCTRYCAGWRTAIPLAGEDCRPHPQPADVCVASCLSGLRAEPAACRSQALDRLACGSTEVWECEDDGPDTWYYAPPACRGAYDALYRCRAAADAGVLDADADAHAADVADGAD